jgi:hypothetical protein
VGDDNDIHFPVVGRDYEHHAGIRPIYVAHARTVLLAARDFGPFAPPPRRAPRPAADERPVLALAAWGPASGTTDGSCSPTAPLSRKRIPMCWYRKRVENCACAPQEVRKEPTASRKTIGSLSQGIVPGARQHRDFRVRNESGQLAECRLVRREVQLAADDQDRGGRAGVRDRPSRVRWGSSAPIGASAAADGGKAGSRDSAVSRPAR